MVGKTKRRNEGSLPRWREEGKNGGMDEEEVVEGEGEERKGWKTEDIWRRWSGVEVRGREGSGWEGM